MPTQEQFFPAFFPGGPLLQVVPDFFQEPVHGVHGLAQVHAQGMDVVLCQELAAANFDRDHTRQDPAIATEKITFAILPDSKLLDGLLDLGDQGRTPGTISANDFPELRPHGFALADG